MSCPSCGTSSPAGAKFCLECGTRLAAVCPSCQTPALPGAKFCPECGTPLTDAPRPRPTTGPTQHLGQPGHAPTQEVRPVSVLFVDLVGFTTLSEQRDAEDVRELLSQYFDAARRVVERYAGTVEKFIGDAVMAVWGSPVAREDDAERAVRAALDVLDAVAALAETTGIATLRARAGVVTGQAASWGAGGEALVVGDRVNTAARLQGLAEPGTVLVDDLTRQRSLASIAYADGGMHHLKGKDELVQVWRAQRIVAGVQGTERVDGLEGRFLGRDSELRLVKELFHATTERGQARMALVVGAPGTGKSRLLSEYSRYTDGLAVMVAWHVGRCLSYGEGVAFWALAEAVRQRFHIAEDAPDAEAEEHLDAGLAQYVADPQERAYVRPRLAALLGLPGGEGFDRQDLMAGWRTFFQRLAEDSPVVLVFEDLQWADTALLDFLDHLLEWAATSRIFVLGLARPELLERRTAWVAGRRNLTVLWLDRLPDAAIGDLLDDLVPGMPEEVRARITAQAEGIPLYAVESIRALVDRGHVVAKGGRYVLQGTVADLDVPPSLTSLLASRLDALTPDERTVAMRMAVFRGGFSREAVLAVAELPASRVDEVLGSLVRREILTVQSSRLSPDQGQYSYAQALLRQVAYDMLGKRERKARHIAAAQHLALTFAEGAEVGEVLASHYRGAYEAFPDDADADDIRRLAHHAYIAAGERGLTVGSPDVAMRSFALAGDLTEGQARLEALVRAADSALAAGRSDRALEYVLPVLTDESLTGELWCEAHLTAAMAHLWAGDPDGTKQAAGAVIERFPEPAEAEMPHVIRGLCLQARAAGLEAPPNALSSEIDRALTLAEMIGDAELLADAMTVRALEYTYQDCPFQAALYMGGALEHSSDPKVLQRAHNNLGDLATQSDSPGGRVHFEEALAIARRRGDRAQESFFSTNLSWLDLLSGAWDAGEARARDTLALLIDFDYPREVQAEQRLTLAAALRYRGHATELAEQLDAPAGEHKADVWMDGLRRWLGLEVRAMRGEDVSEELALESQAALALGLRTEWFRYTWADALGEARRAGRNDLVDELLLIVAGRPQGSVPPFLRAQRMRYQGLRAADAGDVRGGDELLARAVETLEGLGYPYWTACAQLDRAGVLEARGDLDGATQLRDAALITLRSLGAGHVLAEGADHLDLATTGSPAPAG